MSLQTYLLVAMSVLIAASLLLLLARGISRLDARRRGVADVDESPYTEIEPSEAPAAVTVQTTAPMTAPRRGLGDIVRGSAAMAAIRPRDRPHDGEVPIETEVGFVDQNVLEHRIGVVGATPILSAGTTPQRRPPRADADPVRPASSSPGRRPAFRRSSARRRRPADRRRLWRDTAAALVGLAAVLFIAINVMPGKTQGEVLAETATPRHHHRGPERCARLAQRECVPIAVDPPAAPIGGPERDADRRRAERGRRRPDAHAEADRQGAAQGDTSPDACAPW